MKIPPNDVLDEVTYGYVPPVVALVFEVRQVRQHSWKQLTVQIQHSRVGTLNHNLGAAVLCG